MPVSVEDTEEARCAMISATNSALELKELAPFTRTGRGGGGEVERWGQRNELKCGVRDLASNWIDTKGNQSTAYSLQFTVLLSTASDSCSCQRDRLLLF